MSSLSLIPPNVIGYRVITSDTSEGLESAVTEQLKHGYIPYESLIVIKPDTTYSRYLQVMVKQGVPNMELLKSIASAAVNKTASAPQSGAAALQTQLLAVISQLTQKS